jgi:hypothetical protein
MTEETNNEAAEPEDDMSWCYTGDDIDSEAERVEEERNASRIRRFWLPVDATRETRVTFIDDTAATGHKPALALYEHQLYLNGRWTNWFTCLGAKKCPLCQSGEKPYYAGVYTVIDHNEWTDKQGKKHQDEVRLFVAKTDVLRLMQHISQKNDGMRGLVLDVMRKAQKDANVGGNFSAVVKGEITLGENTKLKTKEGKVKLPEDVLPHDYREIFKPKSVETLMKVVGTTQDENDEIKF